MGRRLSQLFTDRVRHHKTRGRGMKMFIKYISTSHLVPRASNKYKKMAMLNHNPVEGTNFGFPTPPLGPISPLGSTNSPILERYTGEEGWSKSSKGHKKSNIALSALTLLAFLFFLNILQNCLSDHSNHGQKYPYYPGYPIPTINVSVPAAVPAFFPGMLPAFRESPGPKGETGDFDFEDSLDVDKVTAGDAQQDLASEKKRKKKRRNQMKKKYSENSGYNKGPFMQKIETIDHN